MNEMKDIKAQRKEASPESIARLRDNFNAHCSLMGQTLENSMPVYKTCLELLKDPQHADNPFLLNLKIVYEVAITFYLAEMDNAAIFRADFTRRADSLYRRTLLLQCYRVISEATKALFGFGKDTRNALWTRLTTTVNLSPYSKEVQEITAGVEKIKTEVINRDARNFASHYNWDALATADFFSSLDDEDIICQDWNQYLFVAERLSFILARLIANLAAAIKNSAPSSHSESVNHALSFSGVDLQWQVEKMLLKPEFVNAIQSTYESTERQLNQCISLCRKFKALCDFAEKYAEKYSVHIEENSTLLSYQKILNAAGILAFMTNDAHAAAIALTDSTSFWESRMHLKRLDVAAYEALDKIVGFTEDSKPESLFRMLGSLVIDLPAQVQNQYSALKEKSESLIKEYGLHWSGRRCSFVHYRSKKHLWLVQTYDNLLSIKVPDYLLKVIGLRNLTTDIIRFITLFAGALNHLEQQRSDMLIKAQFQQFKDMVNKIKDESMRNSALKALDSFEDSIINIRSKTHQKQ